jgi:prophage antirepressor-like protein
MIFVTESGLYDLIIQSRKPAARKFRKWITSEVLPSLRKYGIYSTDKKVMSRIEKAAENKAIKRLLSEIDKSLSATDKRVIARQCMTDDYEVWEVLERKKEDPHMLALMYARATGNKLLRSSFYTREGAETLIGQLTKK